MPIDRRYLGPFVDGAISAILELLNERFDVFDPLIVDDFDEETLVSIIRLCVDFYWANRFELEALWTDPANEYTEWDTGQDLWFSRVFGKRGRGFTDRGFDEIWDKLHDGCWILPLPRDGNFMLTRHNKITDRMVGDKRKTLKQKYHKVLEAECETRYGVIGDDDDWGFDDDNWD